MLFDAKPANLPPVDGDANIGLSIDESNQQHSSEHPTIDHTPSRSKSRGLHIRCPHCSNPVELLTDTPWKASLAGRAAAAFSLVDAERYNADGDAAEAIGRFDLVARLGLSADSAPCGKPATRSSTARSLSKFLGEGSCRPEEVEQFLREARSAAQLRHPNVVPVHEVGRDGDTIFIVSDFVRGVSLSDWLSGAIAQPLRNCTTHGDDFRCPATRP